jgi:hypothetical protein
MALARSVQSWERVFLSGGFRRMWPLALAIAAAGCARSPKPAGLPDLLRMLTKYAREVPDPVVPEGIRLLAEGRGSTRSHSEARALLAALTKAEAAP